MDHLVVPQNDERFHNLPKRVTRLLLAVVLHSRQHLKQLASLHPLHYHVKLRRILPKSQESDLKKNPAYR